MTQSTHTQWRLLNRDGTFNVAHSRKRGVEPTDLYHSLLSLKGSRFAALIITIYFGVNLIFAGLYFACGPSSLEGVSRESWFTRFSDCFFFSVQTLATIGYGRITPTGFGANIIVTIEALTGILGLALMTGLLFSRFSRPTARVAFSNEATISSHDGIPSLVFRIANERMNQILDARISVSLAKNEVTKEGERYRNFYNLKLERSDSPLFALSWTIVHPIDSESPLNGLNESDLINSEAEIIVSVLGIDDTFAQTIYSRFSYKPHEIVWDRYFADMMQRRPDGKVAIDLDRLHDWI